jgi:hypothetical protein
MNNKTDRHFDGAFGRCVNALRFMRHRRLITVHQFWMHPWNHGFNSSALKSHLVHTLESQSRAYV